MPPFALHVDDEGHVLLTRLELSPIAVELGAEADACAIMANFLAQRDYSDR